MKIIKSLITSAITASCIASSAVAASDYKNLHEQIAIMEDILTRSAVEGDDSNSARRMVSVSGYYLAEQGAVFTVDLSHRSAFHAPRVQRVFRTAKAPKVAPKDVTIVTENGTQEIDEESLFGGDFELIIEDAIETANVAVEVARVDVEERRQLMEKQRALAYQLRDLAREERDLNYQRLHVEQEQQDDVKKQLEQIEQRRKEVMASKQQVQQQVSAYKQEVKAIREQRQAEHKRFLESLETQVSKALCLYGNGLRDLPDDEHINVVVKPGRHHEQAQQRVLVFNKEDVKRCVQEKIDAKALLSKAKRYKF
ncbi:hypothetical protein QWY77_03095 [Thalassotalea ponticola]|uniref:hypothetical protein n=1 Tax=Thalassotalea ponticola TaxID=1523392 RepID=UPI0025B4A658|nr:hypothetical protein [Thalassotalea ponticola]MDN3651751.1 hypothetical protein [Thalassotalea ponticola]